MDGARVADLDEIPANSSFLFTVRDGDGEQREAILVRVDGGSEARLPDSGGDADGPDGDEQNGDGDDRDGDGPDGDDRNAHGPDGEASSGVGAWLNYCQHFTHIRLDKGSGVEFRSEELVCTNHGAMFDAASGLCTFGPCEGAHLEAIDVAVERGTVYLTDDEYEFVSVGPTEKDPLDLASKSNVEF